MEASPSDISAIFQTGVIEEGEILVNVNVSTEEDCMLMCMSTSYCKATQLVVEGESSANMSCLVYLDAPVE